jgi:hypothetical protein
MTRFNRDLSWAVGFGARGRFGVRLRFGSPPRFGARAGLRGYRSSKSEARSFDLAQDGNPKQIQNPNAQMTKMKRNRG